MTTARIIITRAMLRTLSRPWQFQVTLRVPGQDGTEYVERWPTKVEAMADAERLRAMTGGTIEDRSSVQRRTGKDERPSPPLNV